MTHNLDSRLERLEARLPANDELIVYIAGEDGYAEKKAAAERLAKVQGRKLVIYHRVYVSAEPVASNEALR